ncbi:MAG: helix-turn-helix transcriptional regulator [Planctomycetaceae bacterium]|nr:helix-turn-helix transcriptional regulator [Planctomycetaceae bacterium]
MGARKTNPDFTNGVPELLILQILSRQSLHGYAIVARIREITDEALQFGEGSIYPILHRLESDGKIVASEAEVNGRNRMVYRITKPGVAQLEASIQNWNRICSAIQLALSGG